MNDRVMAQGNGYGSRSGGRTGGSRPLPPRRVGVVVLLVTVLVTSLVDPALVGLVLVSVLGVAALVGILVLGSVWRTLRRPLGSLTVGDAVVGLVVLRWWRNRQLRRAATQHAAAAAWARQRPGGPPPGWDHGHWR